eukprot:2611357-Rhodomonas_salina.1
MRMSGDDAHPSDSAKCTCCSFFMLCGTFSCCVGFRAMRESRLKGWEREEAELPRVLVPVLQLCNW